jgi:hypothetical protein
MPRKRRTPDRADALAYAVGRKRKLKGPRREFYTVFIDCLLGSPVPGFELDRPEKLCTACSEKVGAR